MASAPGCSMGEEGKNPGSNLLVFRGNRGKGDSHAHPRCYRWPPAADTARALPLLHLMGEIQKIHEGNEGN